MFEHRHCVLLEDFLERRVAARLRQMLLRTQAGFETTREHRASKNTSLVLAREMNLDECAPASVMLFLLLNQPRLFAALGEFAGVGGDKALRYFDGRCYMMRPVTEHFHVWHSDRRYGRQLGLSINPSPGASFSYATPAPGASPTRLAPAGSATRCCFASRPPSTTASAG